MNKVVSQQLQNSQNQKQADDNVSRRSFICKPHLSEDQQNRISEWIKASSAQGKLISKTDVIEQARILSKGGTGSTGWCRGFFSRHPQLLQYIKRAKPTQRQKLSFMCSKQPSSSSQNEKFYVQSNQSNRSQIFGDQMCTNKFSQNQRISQLNRNKKMNNLNNHINNTKNQQSEYEIDDANYDLYNQ